MSRERERVSIRMADGGVYEGEISLHGRDRVVDTLNHEAPFFNLRDVRLPDGEEAPLLVLNKRQVVSVRELDPGTQNIKLTRVLRKGGEPGGVFGT